MDMWLLKKVMFKMLKVCFMIFFIILVLGVSFARGESDISRDYNRRGWGQDPFVSYISLKNKKKAKLMAQRDTEPSKRQRIKRELEDIIVTGILKGENNLAIINGEIYKEGEVTNGKKLSEVSTEYVIFKQAGYSFKKPVQRGRGNAEKKSPKKSPKENKPEKEKEREQKVEKEEKKLPPEQEGNNTKEKKKEPDIEKLKGKADLGLKKELLKYLQNSNLSREEIKRKAEELLNSLKESE